MGEKKTLYPIFRKQNACALHKNNSVPAVQQWKNKDKREMKEELRSERDALDNAREKRHRDIFTPVFLACGCQFDCNTLYGLPEPLALPEKWEVL